VSASSGPAGVPGQESTAECDVLIIGAGPGGYSAAFRSADLGLSTILVERFPTLGGVCLNVGCIPSKALLHLAAVRDAALELQHCGVGFGEPVIDLDRVRAWKGEVVGRLTRGLGGMARGRKVEVVRGSAVFLDPHRIEVQVTEGEGREPTGEVRTIHFRQCIIAAGSRPIRLPFLPDHPGIVDSTGALELTSIPDRMLVIGGGIIGLEIGTVYASLGARVDVVEALEGPMQGPDRALVQVWEKHNRERFHRFMLKTRATAVDAQGEELAVTFEGEAAPEGPQSYDLVLQAIGRIPNGDRLGAEAAGVEVEPGGRIPVDGQMRTNVSHIFAIGDIVGNPMLAHKASHQGRVAAEAAAGHPSYFDTEIIPNVAYTDPEVAWVGLTEMDAAAEGRDVGVGTFPWRASGRAIANGRDEGLTRLIFDRATGRIVGAGIVGTHAGDLIGELALAIELGADAEDIGRTIHPHPTLGESIGMAAEEFLGVCTELPPRRA